MEGENTSTEKVKFWKKKDSFRHYISEFIILFLAITLGFFVENKRDELAARDLEKTLMLEMMDELRSDTVLINELVAYRSRKIQQNDSLIYLLQSNDRDEHIRQIYSYALFAATRFKLYYIGNTMASLNSGGFYNIRSKKVTAEIRQYYLLCNDLISNQENGDVYGGQRYIDLVRRMLDAGIAYQFLRNSIKLPDRKMKLFNDDPELINEFCFTINYINLSFSSQIRRLNEMKKRAAELLTTIPQEYELNN